MRVNIFAKGGVSMSIKNQKTENFQKEGCALLFGFRLLSEEEQRIAYAVLEGMKLQKQLDSQRKEKQLIEN